MPWSGSCENPLAAETLADGSNYLGDETAFIRSLQLALESAINPFGYKSLRDLAAITTEEKLPTAESLLTLQKSTPPCKRCLLYERLLREVAEVLLSELEECQMSPSSSAGASALASSIERLRGVVEVLECSPFQSLSGSPAMFSAADSPSRGRIPQAADAILNITSPLSQGSTLLTSASDTLNASTDTWFYDLLVPNGTSPEEENNLPKGKSKEKGISDTRSQSRSRSLSICSTLSGSARLKPSCSQCDRSARDSNSAKIRRTTYFPRGASYSLSTLITNTEAPPRVKVTDQTVFGRNGGKKVINDYVVLRNIGRGSHGRVVLVQHQETKELYAMKILKFGKKLNERQLKVIRSEIAVLKRVSHPHVVRLHEVIGDKCHKRIFLILQYVSGGTIARSVTTTTIVPIPEAQLRQYTKQILSAIKCLHSRGVFHRDIKPENILIDGNGNTYLADFGVCAISSGMGVAGVEGTPAFMAPEVCSGKLEVVGELVDVWALGVTLYQLMYGFLPFRAFTQLDLTRKIVNCPVVFPDDVKKRGSVGSTSTIITYVKRMSTSALSNDDGKDNDERWDNPQYEDLIEEEAPNDKGEAVEEGEDEDNEFKYCKIISSRQFKELIRGVLCKDPDHRWTLRRIGESAWLTQELSFERAHPTFDSLAFNSPTNDNSAASSPRHPNPFTQTLKESARHSPAEKKNTQKRETTPTAQSRVRCATIREPQRGNTGASSSVEGQPVLSSYSIEPPLSLPTRLTTANESKPSRHGKSWKNLLHFSWGGKKKT
ncbi:protein kinase domain [Trypanosoma theileri]|uniref:Protein kinase domain n=1 Tax=Trypanosoma theileri TaxID=67003 RepID=A0A1X0P5Y9_9TRYP|nr:protein kinase domain [Trypanosoma theileri]ORC92268.1 protein kinase domain [Trypanosoma theileri]